MPDPTPAPKTENDFYDAKRMYTVFLEKYTKSKAAIYQSPIAEDKTAEMEIGFGGKTVNYSFFDFLNIADGAAMAAADFEVGDTLVKGKLVESLVSVPIKTIALSSTANKRQERLSPQTIEQPFFNKLMTAAVDKISAGIDGVMFDAVKNDALPYTRVATDLTCIQAILSAKTLLGEAVSEQTILTVNPKTYKKLLDEALAALTVSGDLESTFATYLRCTVSISSKVADDKAIISTPGAVWFTLDGFETSEVILENFEKAYELSADVSVFVPAINGQKKVIYADLTAVSAG